MRVLPFAATFAVAIFITSFFINITAPTFRGHHRSGFHKIKRLKMENERLKNENLRLKNEMESKQWNSRHVNGPIRGFGGLESPEAPPPPPGAHRYNK